MKKMICVTLVVGLLVLLAGCSGLSDQLVGTWEITGYGYTFTFAEDRKVTVGYGGYSDTGRWDLSDNMLTIIANGQIIIEGEIIVDEDTMTLEVENGTITTLHRVR